MNATVTVEVTRPLLHRGERVEAGTWLHLPAEDAVPLVDAGRARLHSQADAPALEAVRRAELARTMRAASRPAVMPVHDQPGRPW